MGKFAWKFGNYSVTACPRMSLDEKPAVAEPAAWDSAVEPIVKAHFLDCGETPAYSPGLPC